VGDLFHALQPEALLERFAYRKKNGNGNSDKDFLQIKGAVGQLEMDEKIRASIKEENELVGFKCLHYSVTESSGFVEVTVIKKVLNQALVFGIRTVVGSAIKNKDY